MEDLVPEVKEESEFAQKYHAEKLLKRSKKKARKQLLAAGLPRASADKMVKQALGRIMSKPERKAAGRSR